MLIALCAVRARCLGTEGYKHSMVLTYFGHIASQSMNLAHGINFSRIPKPNIFMKAGFNFVFIKAMSKLELAFMCICTYSGKIVKYYYV